MKSIFLPLFIFPSVVLNHKTTFYATNEKVVVEAPGKLMRQLIVLCDGTHTQEEVIQCSEKEWDRETVRKLLRALRHKKILAEARQLSEEVWKVIESPLCFPNNITDTDIAKLAYETNKRNRQDVTQTMYSAQISPFNSLLNHRRSGRLFSGMPVTSQSVVDILWSAYGQLEAQKDGCLHKTVSSAGALYPLTVCVALFKQTGDLQPAIYNVCFGKPMSVGFRFVSGNLSQFSRAFLDPNMLQKAHGVIVVNGSFSITGEKYGNRSMLYVILEAGHVAQNIHLATVEQKVASVDVGGFTDKLLAEAINLPEHYHPLTTMVFGCKEDESQGRTINSNIEVQWAIPMSNQYRLPFAIASARVSTGRSWSHGRDITPALARIKAIAEAKEWAACSGIPNTLIRARFSDLKTAIDPESIIKFHSAQYRLKKFPFKPLSKKAEYEWTEGYDELTNSLVHILADLVYFPYFPRTPYYAYANSSGVAAHPDRQKAVEISVLELIERDSFMIAYFARLNFPTVREQTLPLEIKKRIRELRKSGFKVWVKDHSIDLAPVVSILAQSEKDTYTTCASCASFDVGYAVDHALMEVEASVLARLQNGSEKHIAPYEVAMPLDHGRIYGQKKYFHRADFLIHGQDSIAFQDVGKNVAQSWQKLLVRFRAKEWRIFAIPLCLPDKYGGNGDLHIVRSIVPGLVPMTFGYRQEPAGMMRIYTIAEIFGNRQLSYRELTRFPHPFA